MVDGHGTQERDIWSRLAFAALCVAGLLIAFDRYAEDYRNALLWTVIFVAAIFIARRSSLRDILRRAFTTDGFSAFIRNETVLLAALAAWFFISAYFSDRKDISLASLPTEGWLYIALALLWLHLWKGRDDFQRALKRLGIVILILGTTLGFIAAAIYAHGSPHLQEWMETVKYHGATFVRREDSNWGGSVWRLQFPFGHHNRMAYFSMLAALVALWLAVMRPWRLIWIAFAFMAFLDLAVTLNRGAWCAFLAGAVTMFTLRLGRRSIWLILYLPLAFALLPHTQRERIGALFESRTYTNSKSTIAARVHHWAVAIEMIRTNPVLGIGYGFRNFENYYSKIATDKFGWTDYEAVHAHNVWLQVGAESGIPAVAMFLAWSVIRWAMLARLWKRRASLGSRDAALLILWIGLEIAIQAFCLVNLPLRRSLGLLTWGIWIVMMADLARMEIEFTAHSRVKV